MARDLKRRTLSGLTWSLLERAGNLGAHFVISIILARLLLPAEFGLMAMLVVFTTVAQSFLDSGFGSALIQKQDATRVDESSIFYFNIVVGIIAAGLLSLAAPWIAGFYRMPILAPMTRVLSLNLVINSFGLIQSTLLTKRMDFRTQMRISVPSVILSGVVGIVMAYLGFGVWSIVAQSLAANTFRTISLWVFNTWRPVRKFSFASLRAMFGFGSKMLLTGLLDTLYSNIYNVVIGKLFSATDLGYYTRARHIEQFPAANLSNSVGRVTYPVYASIQDDKPRLKRGVQKTLTSLTMLNFPMMIGLAIVARPLIVVLLTEKWLPSVPYLQLMCFTGILNPMQTANVNVLKAQGRSDLVLRLSIIKKVLSVIAIAITWRWGIIAMIYGQIVNSVAWYYLNSYYSGKFLNYPMWEQVRDVLPAMALALLTGGVMYAVGLIPLPNELIQLLLQIAAGAALYPLLCRIFRLNAFGDIIEMLKPRLPQFGRNNLQG